MSSGRTMWYARDVARHRRALMVELRGEFGPAALAVDDVLCALAKEQNSGGAIRDGFASVALESSTSPGQAKEIIERAAEIGWLDDLTIDADGRRFRVRVSGWRADQDKGTAAWRQASKRARLQDEQTVTSRDESQDVPESHLTAQHSTTGEGDARAQIDDEKVRETVDILKTCPRLQFDLELMGVANALLAYPNVDHKQAAHTTVSNASDPNYRTTDAGRALRYALEGLDRRHGQVKDIRSAHEQRKASDPHEATRERRAAALERLTTGGEAA